MYLPLDVFSTIYYVNHTNGKKVVVMLKLSYNKEDHIPKQELNKAISSQINNKENCDFQNINRKKVIWQN